MTRPTPAEPISLSTADGLTLEAQLASSPVGTDGGPDSGSPPAVAVVCHPHPLYGGSMHNNVVDRLFRDLPAAGVPALRFNFRGVGASEGSHGGGESERGDVVAAIDALASRHPGVPVLVAGYSFGADVALAVGTRFTNVDTAAWRIPASGTRIAQIDIEPTQIGRNYPVDLAVPGDIRAVLRTMLDLLESDNPELRPDRAKSGGRSARDEVTALTGSWRREFGVESDNALAQDTSPVHPLQVIRALRGTMDAEGVLICDSGFNQIWGGQYFEVHSPGRSYMGPRGFGVMGFALPAAIAHSLAEPDRQVVALCGDGGFAMVIQELETARRTGAKLTACIMNNSNLQYIKENQRLLYDSRFISTDFSELDYAAIAQAFGCVGIRVERSADLEPALAKALASDLPAVVDVRIMGDALPDRMSLQKLDG